MTTTILRAFISVSLPKNTLHSILKIRSDLQTFGADVKWVNEKNIHLTLKFLGSCHSDTLEKISESLETIGKNTDPITTSLTQFGCFPSLDRPKVIWIGLADDNHSIEGLAKKIDDAAFQAGIPREDRNFKGHITLGRVRSQRNFSPLKHSLSQFKALPAGSFMISEIHLMKSTLTSSGPVYENLRSFSLRN